MPATDSSKLSKRNYLVAVSFLGLTAGVALVAKRDLLASVTVKVGVFRQTQARLHHACRFKASEPSPCRGGEKGGVACTGREGKLGRHCSKGRESVLVLLGRYRSSLG